jgi:hypothetical protein
VSRNGDSWPAGWSPPPPSVNQTRTRFFGRFWLRCTKSIGATVLAMFIAADIGVNLAHNAGAVVTRAIPFAHNSAFYFDPLAVLHDLERIAR